MRSMNLSAEHISGIAKSIMETNRHLKTVLVQLGPVVGDFRLRQLMHAAGEKKTVTLHKESGCSFAVDVCKCYFSPRLSYERSRIARLVKPCETIINMFAGVGCFSIVIAKRERAVKVFSIDINPEAIYFMKKNVCLNRVYPQVIPIVGESKEIVDVQFQGSADRVLMPLPEKAFEYLASAVSSLKSSGGWIHYYDFVHACKHEDPAGKAKAKVIKKLSKLNVPFEIPFSRVVRPTGPNWYQVVLDIHAARVSDKS